MQGIEVVSVYNEGKKCWIPHHAIMCVADAKRSQEDAKTTIIYLVSGEHITIATNYETIVAMLEDNQ